MVKNLTVRGDITPSGTQTQVGGIAGTIDNCAFSGIVMGGDYVGGIAGKNETGGTISLCQTSGVVRGTRFTGGIAGQNAGTVLNCTNKAAVNTAVSEEDLSSGLEDVESTIYTLLKREDVKENAVTTDTGGVAGYSNGILQSCTNLGAVGYPHVGYNVGGIVGQMAPDITLQFSSNGLEELQTELNGLHNLIDATLDDAQSASDTVSGRITRISGYADAACDSAHNMTGQLGDFVDSNVDTANNILLLVERYLAKAAPIMEDLAAASDSTTQAIAALRQLLDTLDGMEEYNDQLLAQLQDACRELAQGCDDLESGLTALENAFALMEGGVAKPDTQPVRDDIAALREAVLTLETTIGRALEEIGISGAVTPDTKAQLKAGLKTVLDCYGTTIRDLVDLLVHTNFSALREQNLETLRQILGYLRSAMGSFAGASGHFSSAMNALADAMGTLREINAQMGPVFDQLDEVLANAQRASTYLTSAFTRLAQWAQELSGENPGSFTGLGDGFGDSSDSLNTALTGISNELTALNGEMSSATTALLSDVRAINNQFMKVMNLFLNVLNNTQNVDYTDVYEDVSEESLQSATRGKVLECTNYGSVEADRNVGGLVGSMAIEYDLDPEDDLLSNEHRTTRFTYQTRAILLSCDNYGAVQAKKSCAGGLVGRMDLGTVSDCGGYGPVSSENGDYVGGVCGLSLSSIRHSYAKCTLTGRKYVGGIVGSGSRVSDCLSMVAIADYTQLGGRRRNAPAGRRRGAAPAPPRRAEETDARRRISTPQKVEKQRQTGAAFLYDECVSAVIVAGGGVDHDEGDDLAVHLHIDLIDTALQLLIVIRRDVVVVQQALFKFRLPGVLIGVRIPGGIFRRCVRVSGGVCLLTGRVPLRRGGRGRYTAAAGKREHQQCRQQGGDDSVFHSHTPFIFVRRTSPVRPSDFPV